MAKVSVIIPTYNRAHLVGDAIQSVLNQSFDDLEVLVVDDGSVDNTADVVRQFNDSRIRYIYQVNKGPAGAMNTGIRASLAPYLTFLGSDDLFLPDRLAIQVGFLNVHPEVGLVYNPREEVDLQGKILGIAGSYRPAIILRDVLLSCPFGSLNVMLRRSWADRVGLFDESLGAMEDWDLWIRLALEGCRMVGLPQVLSRSKIHGGKLSIKASLHRAVSFRILDKAFSDPGLPREMPSLRREAYANCYFAAACREYEAHLISEAKRDLAEALSLVPGLISDDATSAMERLVQWALRPTALDPEDFLLTVFDNLPQSASPLRAVRRRALGHVQASLGFRAYASKDLQKARRALGKAVLLDPRWLANRGVVSIMVRAIFPSLFEMYSWRVQAMEGREVEASDSP